MTAELFGFWIGIGFVATAAFALVLQGMSWCEWTSKKRLGSWAFLWGCLLGILGIAGLSVAMYGKYGLDGLLPIAVILIFVVVCGCGSQYINKIKFVGAGSMNREETAKDLVVFLIEKNPELVKGENNDLAKVAEKTAAAYKSILTALKS